MRSKYRGGTGESGCTLQLHPALVWEIVFTPTLNNSKKKKSRVCAFVCCVRVVSLCGEVKPISSRKCRGFFFFPSLSVAATGGSPGTAECAFHLGSLPWLRGRARTHVHFVQSELLRVSALKPFALAALLWPDFPGFHYRTQTSVWKNEMMQSRRYVYFL